MYSVESLQKPKFGFFYALNFANLAPTERAKIKVLRKSTPMVTPLVHSMVNPNNDPHSDPLWRPLRRPAWRLL